MEGLTVDILAKNKELTSLLLKDQLHVRRLMAEYICKVKCAFLHEIEKELRALLSTDEQHHVVLIDGVHPEGLSVTLWTGDLQFSGDEGKSYGLGYQFFKDGKGLKYSSASGYGNTGKGMFIGILNAHYGLEIDHANGLLSDAYIDRVADQGKWQSFIKQNVDAILMDFMSI